jgi:hypothetical protein
MRPTCRELRVGHLCQLQHAFHLLAGDVPTDEDGEGFEERTSCARPEVRVVQTAVKLEDLWQLQCGQRSDANCPACALVGLRLGERLACAVIRTRRRA